MADGELTITIDAALAERLRAAAEAAGESVDVYVRHALETISDDPVDWAEDVRVAEAYDGDGVSFSVEEGLAVFDAAVKRRFDTSR